MSGRSEENIPPKGILILEGFIKESCFTLGASDKDLPAGQ
jgi:hypothetical protein